jgi:hypothetical protein
MCDDQVSVIEKTVQSDSARVPKIVVQRVEDIFPAVKESMVSVLCLHPQDDI